MELLRVDEIQALVDFGCLKFYKVQPPTKNWEAPSIEIGDTQSRLDYLSPPVIDWLILMSREIHQLNQRSCRCHLDPDLRMAVVSFNAACILMS